MPGVKYRLSTVHRSQFTVYSSLFTVLAILTCALAGCAPEAPVNISVNAQSAVIIGAKNGDVLFEKNDGLRSPPASTAKIMTAIIAIENAPLNRKMTVSQKAANVEPVVAGIESGARYSLHDLLAAMLIRSANDAAVAVAENIAGSEEKFAVLMNEKAREIGMDSTYFANSSGLPTGEKDRQYTTSGDLAKMMRYALRHKIIIKFMSKKEYVISESDGAEIKLRSNNKLLFRSPDAPWGKTGYTNEARRTFAGIDPAHTPHIVIALLRSDDLWNDISVLEDSGLKLYDLKYGTVFSRIVKWVVKERQKGCRQLEALFADKLS